MTAMLRGWLCGTYSFTRFPSETRSAFTGPDALSDVPIVASRVFASHRFLPADCGARSVGRTDHHRRRRGHHDSIRPAPPMWIRR